MIKDFIFKDNINYNNLGGYYYINNEILNLLHINVYQITFDKLYRNIIIDMYNNGYINDLESINIIKNHISNSTEYFIFKDLSYNKSKSYENIISYIYHMYDYILDNNKDNILIIDTDSIIFKDSLNLNKVEYKYSIDEFKYFMAFDKKKYVFITNEIKTVGFYDKYRNSEFKNRSLNNFKYQVRKHKLKNISK